MAIGIWIQVGSTTFLVAVLLYYYCKYNYDLDEMAAGIFPTMVLALVILLLLDLQPAD